MYPFRQANVPLGVHVSQVENPYSTYMSDEPKYFVQFGQKAENEMPVGHVER